MARPSLSPHGTTTVRATLPLSLCEAIDIEAEKSGVKRAALIRQLLTEALDWSEEEAKAS